MAILIKKDTEYGVKATYWKITNWKVLDARDGKININVSIEGFANNTALRPLNKTRKDISIIGIDKSFSGSLYTMLYTEVMKNEYFAEGTSDE